MQGPSGAPEVERLAGAELVPGHALGRAPHLAVARGDVVDDGVAEHVLQRARDLDEAPGLADDDGELDLAVDLLGEPLVERDRLVGTDHAVGGLDEKLRLLAADRGVRLLGVVVLVVAAAAQDRGRAMGRGERDILQRQDGCFGGLARIARAAFIPAAPDLMKLSALANIALSPDASSGSTTTSPASRPRRSSPDFTNVTSFIDPPQLSQRRHCARLAPGRQPTKRWHKVESGMREA